jgi:hypothetical protein
MLFGRLIFLKPTCKFGPINQDVVFAIPTMGAAGRNESAVDGVAAAADGVG